MHQPRGKEEWEEVTKVFNSNVAPMFHRTDIQLRDKYHSIARARGTTGNTHLHEFTIKARQIEQLIEQKSQIVQSEDPFTLMSTDPDGDDGDIEDEWNTSIEAEESLTQSLTENDLNMPSSSSSSSFSAIVDAATTSHTPIASPSPSSTSFSSPSPLRPPTGKRKRGQIDTAIREALEREEQKRDSMDKVMTMMATAITAMATNAQAAERRHEQLMALLLAKKNE